MSRVRAPLPAPTFSDTCGPRARSPGSRSSKKSPKLPNLAPKRSPGLMPRTPSGSDGEPVRFLAAELGAELRAGQATARCDQRFRQWRLQRQMAAFELRGIGRNSSGQLGAL